MGTQGEIYAVLGTIIPAKRTEDPEIYLVNGRRILVECSKDKEHDIYDGFHGAADLKNPKLHVKVLDYRKEFGEVGDFRGRALVGYAIANESYVPSAKIIPSGEKIEGLKPKLIKDIEDELGFGVKPSDLELFLLFEWIQ